MAQQHFNRQLGKVIPSYDSTTLSSLVGIPGAVVYNTTDQKLMYWDEGTSAWKEFAEAIQTVSDSVGAQSTLVGDISTLTADNVINSVVIGSNISVKDNKTVVISDGVTAKYFKPINHYMGVATSAVINDGTTSDPSLIVETIDKSFYYVKFEGFLFDVDAADMNNNVLIKFDGVFRYYNSSTTIIQEETTFFASENNPFGNITLDLTNTDVDGTDGTKFNIYLNISFDNSVANSAVVGLLEVLKAQ